MAYRDKPLDNPINWSFRVGRLFAIDIRVHIAFVLCAVVLVAMELPQRGSSDAVAWGRVLVDALGTYALLFLIVLLHEFGHCWGARTTGGEADEILLWPLGGLAYVNPPHNPRAHMITTVAGPMVNVIICACCSAILVAWIGTLGAVPWNPIHPTWPVDETIVPTSGQWWVLRFYGISYFLLLINLLPIYPFDGGRIVQAWLWPRKGYRASTMIATSTGMIGAVLIGLMALFMEEPWLLLMIAVFGYMTCWQNRRILKEFGEIDLGGMGFEFSGGSSYLTDDHEVERKPGFFERRRAKKAALKAERKRQREEAHQRAVEAALRKVSKHGLESLTPRERHILEEETRRRRTAGSGANDDTV